MIITNCSSNNIVVFVAPHTHWDREWYLPFQKFRYQLVNIMKKLLEYMNHHPLYKFTFDGQSIVIRDFLELEPSEESRLRTLAKEGRLLFGPWYVQSDEWLISGESIIRNLELGLNLARKFGKPLMVGYVPDTFGHVPQLPEIFKLFGIRHVMLWRGVPRKLNSTPFWWMAPSGSKVLVTYLFDSYSNGAYLPCDEEHLKTTVQQMIARSKQHLNIPLLLLMNGTDHAPPQLGLEKVLHQVREKAKLNVLFGTLQEYIELLDQIMKDKNVQLITWEGELRDSCKAPILSGVLSSRIYLKQYNVRLQRIHEDYLFPLSAIVHLLGGNPPMDRIYRSLEMLIENHSHDCIGGCSTDEVHNAMMQRFRATEQLAMSILEDLKRMLSKLVPYPRQFTETMKTTISTGPIALINPHSFPFEGPISIRFEIDPQKSSLSLDDVVGTTLKARTLGTDLSCPFYCQQVIQDIIYDYGISPFHLNRLPEMVTRFQAEGWYYHSHEVVIRKNVENPEIRVYMSRTRRAMRELSIAELIDAMSRFELQENRFIRVLIVSLPQLEGLLMIEDEIPPFSWKYAVLSSEKFNISQAKNDTGIREYEFSSDHYSLKITDSGFVTINITSTAAKYGMSMSKFLYFEDEGDAGDEYNFSPVSDPPLIFDKVTSWKVIEASTFHQKILLYFELFLPMELTASRRHRSRQSKKCELHVIMTVYKTLPRMDFRVIFRNKVKDHRLRAGFRFPFLEHSLHNSSAFYVISRTFPRDQHENAGQVAEMKSPTVPQGEFSTLFHELLNLGITVVNDGLPEIELVPREEQNITELKITLLRCVGWLSRDDLTTRAGHAGPAIETPDAQCLGDHKFNISLYFHQAEHEWFRYYTLAKKYLSTPLSIIISPSSLPTALVGNDFELERPLIELDSETVIISSLEPLKNGLRVRMVNFSNKESTSKLKVLLRNVVANELDCNSTTFRHEQELVFKRWEIKNCRIFVENEETKEIKHVQD